jgi:hypothetical protein
MANVGWRFCKNVLNGTDGYSHGSRIFALISPTAFYISEAIAECYLNDSPTYPRKIIIPTVPILHLESAFKDSLRKGGFVRPFQPYLPIT